MAVRIRLKRLGRRHRPFYRVCAMDARSPRDGRVIEELGFYDPMVAEVDARAVLKGERVDYWLSVGAQPSDNVRVLIKKYGSSGTHLEQQRAALEKLKIKPQAPPPVAVKGPEPEQPAAEVSTEEAPAEAATDEAATDKATAAEAATGEATTEEQPAAESTSPATETSEDKESAES